MRKIPTSIKDHISNAHYYLEAANKFPPPTRDAIHILLLLTAWENIQIAQEELSAWAQQTITSKKLYKSHAYKFEKARKSITRIILGPPGTPARTIEYSSSTDFEKLILICRYGLKTGSKELANIFERGWHSDAFERSLINKIGWEEMMIEVYESLPNK